MYNSKANNKNQKKSEKPEPVSHRDQLGNLLFRGSGDKFLGYDLRRNQDCTCRFSKTYRYKKIPDFVWNSKTWIERVNPMKRHQTGEIQGLIIDELTTEVPFLAPDADHHRFNADDYEQHKADCKKIEETINDKIKSSVVTAEINKEDCSVKWFIFPKDGKGIPIEQATKAAEFLHKELLKEGIDIEIFPYNLKSIRLPLHPDKITIVDTGVLETKKVGRVEAYSPKVYLESLARGNSYCKYAFEANLDACSNNLVDGWSKPLLQDSQKSEISCESRPSAKVPTNRVLSKLNHSKLDNIRSIQNAFTKDHQLCLYLFQKFGVISSSQFLEYKEQYEVYNGGWSITAKRHRRAIDVVKFVSRSYRRITGESFLYEIDNHRALINKWFPCDRVVINRSHTNTRFNTITLEATGDVEYERRVRITPDDALSYFTLAEEMRKTSLLNDGGVPEKRLKKMMPLLGLTFNAAKWRACRDIFHNLGILICDRIKIVGKKSYCYSIGVNHPDYVRTGVVTDTTTYNTESVVDTYKMKKIEPIFETVGADGLPPP